jgi:hypothetical protein
MSDTSDPGPANPVTPDYRGPADKGPPVPPPTPAGLSPEHIAEVARAKTRSKKIQSAIRVATIDAWITAFFAVGAILTSCGGIDQILIGVALAVVAFNSFRGVRGLKRLDTAAPARLALNQILLASAIILYAAYQLWAVSTGHSALGEAVKSQLSAPGIDLDDIIRLVTWILKLTYVLLIVGTIIFQGLAALYYKSRRKVLDDYISQTPQWVIDLQRAQAA